MVRKGLPGAEVPQESATFTLLCPISVPQGLQSPFQPQIPKCKVVIDSQLSSPTQPHVAAAASLSCLLSAHLDSGHLSLPFSASTSICALIVLTPPARPPRDAVHISPDEGDWLQSHLQLSPGALFSLGIGFHEGQRCYKWLHLWCYLLKKLF